MSHATHATVNCCDTQAARKYAAKLAALKLSSVPPLALALPIQTLIMIKGTTPLSIQIKISARYTVMCANHNANMVLDLRHKFSGKPIRVLDSSFMVSPFDFEIIRQ